ncbi:hypothetical protein ZIOFF_062111 [Zingiber officinale]|uniref:Integrase catalytic domain-containing protein n=1 Tax=Zingiber officinale TaxID=94328 RepID=A0A8J5F4Z8_ZINOF|nr:hypothetical protein ZIOFF_062111 [Zingiber officinale]
MDGYSISFDDKVVVKKNREVICSGTLVEKQPLEMNQTYLWHLRLGHINLSRIQRLIADGPLGSLVVENFPTCKSCLEGKMTKRPFKAKGYIAKDVLELVHSDLYVPITIQARGGFECFIYFIDDYSRYGYIYLMRHKSECFDKFKEYKADVEKRHGKIIKTLRSDCGGDYLLGEFKSYLSEAGIQSQLSAPSTPQQNSVTERRNMIFMEMVRSMMSYSELPNSFWGYALEMAVYILNLSNTCAEADTDKLESRTEVRLFVGYPKGTKEEDYVMNHKPMSKIVLEEIREDTSTLVPTVWELVEPSNGIKVIGCKWVYKRKRGADGKVETFKITFLNRSLEENIHMNQPEGVIAKGKDHLVCKLNRSIYRLKQASRSWNIQFNEVIQSYRFIQCPDKSCVYKNSDGNVMVFLILYVDNILLIGNNVKVLSDVRVWLPKQFDMEDLGECEHILGIKEIRDRKKRMLCLSQASYFDTILARFSMHNSKKGFLPFRHGVPLSKEMCPKTSKEIEDMEAVPYASAVGSLMYAMLCTRSDICFAVGMVSKYQSNPG